MIGYVSTEFRRDIQGPDADTNNSPGWGNEFVWVRPLGRQHSLEMKPRGNRITWIDAACTDDNANLAGGCLPILASL